MTNRTLSVIVWLAIAVIGAFAFAGIALNRSEPVSAAWLVTAAICVYLIAYRFYSKFLAEKVLQLDDNRQTPAERLDYVPTNKYVNVFIERRYNRRGPDAAARAFSAEVDTGSAQKMRQTY